MYMANQRRSLSEMIVMCMMRKHAFRILLKWKSRSARVASKLDPAVLRVSCPRRKVSFGSAPRARVSERTDILVGYMWVKMMTASKHRPRRAAYTHAQTISAFSGVNANVHAHALVASASRFSASSKLITFQIALRYWTGADVSECTYGARGAPTSGLTFLYWR
jgi:hypothetical protein